MQQAQQLGRYHLLDRVAFGGMAEIYRAKTADAQGRLHLVAVKRVLGHLSEDDEFIQMLIDEARLTALLRHPNIAQLHEFTRIGNEYFIAMEYVDGKDVRAMLEKAKQAQEFLPEEHIAYIGMMTARGLHAAHIQTDRDGNPLRIVHRDVSPSNVLLSYAGDVKLCDFGIAKAQGARSQTKTGVIKGKVKYMSPEQAMGRKLDHRSDLFSLGTLLFEMLALQAPFTANTEIELLFAVRDARRQEIDQLRPNIHPELKKIIDLSLAKSRSERFRTGEEMAESLKAFLDTYYPSYTAANLSRHLRTVFTREIEREATTLAEYVIDGATSNEVGENLLADVLGPDAEYTQFTAAFTQAGSAPPDVRAQLAAMMAPPPQPGAMRIMSAVTMPGTESIEEFDVLPTAHKPRFEAMELGVPEPIDTGPSAQTLPRAMSGSLNAPRRPTTGTPIVPGAPSPLDIPVVRPDMQPGRSEPPMMRPDVPAVPVDQEEGTMIIMRHTPSPGPSWAPVQMPSRQAQPIAPPPSSGGLYDDEFHAQETRVLTREQMELLKPKPRAAPVMTPIAPSEPPEGLHDASTQILDVRSLPANIQQVLQSRQQAPAPAANRPTTSPPLRQPTTPPLRKPTAPPLAPPPSSQPIPALPSTLPSMELVPLEGEDFHEAQTAYLDWQPLEPETKLDLPEPSALHPAQALQRQTGAHAPIAIQPPPSGRPTGLQSPIAQRQTGLQSPIAPPPSSLSPPPAPPPPPRPAARPAAPSSLSPPPPPPPPPPKPAARPTAPPVLATPSPMPIPPSQPPARPTSGHAPIAAPPPSRPTGAQAPISARPVEGRATPSAPLPAQALPPAPTIPATPAPAPLPAPPRGAPQRPPVVLPASSAPAGEEEEWESLPHLDSTMIAQASPKHMPPSASAPRTPASAPPAAQSPAGRPINITPPRPAPEELSPLPRPEEPPVDQGDLPTIPPPSSRGRDAMGRPRPSLASLPKLDPALGSPLSKLQPVGSAPRSRSLARLLSLGGPPADKPDDGGLTPPGKNLGPSLDNEDPFESTVAAGGAARPRPRPPAEPLEDLPTPVRGTSIGGAAAARGEPADDFEEDTNKGDTLGGVTVPRPTVDPSHDPDSDD